MPPSLLHPAPGRILPTRDRTLPLLAAGLHAHAAGGIARVTLRQHFHNAHDEPLTVAYSLPLPADAAVGAFCFVAGDRRIVGEIDRRHAARDRFEQALLNGQTAALLEQDRSSLFSQEIGNIPPHTDLVAEIVLDLRLRWLDDGAWELRFPLTAAPRYLGAPGRIQDPDRIAQDIADAPLPARLRLALEIGDQLASAARPASPSHPICADQTDTAWRVTLPDAGVPVDRDVVVRWSVATSKPGATLSLCRPASIVGEREAFGLLTIIPPSRSAGVRPLVRDLIVLPIPADP